MKTGSLIVPVAVKRGLRTIYKWSDDSRQELIKALSIVGAKATTEDLAESVEPLVHHFISPSEAYDAINSLLSLYSYQYDQNLSDSEMIERVALSRDSRSSERVFTEAEADDAKASIAPLLGLEDSIGMTAKVSDVANEYERVFLEVRILTDIRPVFHKDLTQPPTMNMVHNLKIEYHDKSEVSEFFVALTTSDLKTLHDVVQRAYLKVDSIKTLLENKSIEYLEG